MRWHANRGKPAPLYFCRDHHGHEVDFVIPVGERLRLFECKWGETPAANAKGFGDIEKLFGKKNIVSRTSITPHRGPRELESSGVLLDDSVELRSLESA